VPTASSRYPTFPFRNNASQWEIAEVTLDLVRILFLGSLIAFYYLFVVVLKGRKEKVRHAEETTGLLSGQQTPNGFANGSANGYGTHVPAGKRGRGHGEERDQPSWVRPTTIPTRTWWEYVRGYSIFFPYLWPSKDRRLQIVVIICIVIVALQRGLNVLVPYQVGVITDDLSGENGAVHMPWKAIVV
jgi:ATP-binding cassette, subfamily B, vacuolar membrane transporter HMT1/ACLQ